MHQTNDPGSIGSTFWPSRHALPQSTHRSFIKLIVQNPLDVPIQGPITVLVRAGNGPSSLPPPTPATITDYRTQGGLFFYKPGEIVPGIDNKYTRSAKSSPGVPPPAISAGTANPITPNRTVTWTLDSIPGACIAGIGRGCVIDGI